VERRRCQTKGFDCTYRHYGRDADDQLGNGNDDRIAVLGRPDKLLILSGIEAVEGPLPVVRLLSIILAGSIAARTHDSMC
jgi:hypothetical protein